MTFKLAVYIGRFQPFHNSHLKCCLNGLELADRLLIFLGSANAAPDIRNPWGPGERTEYIFQALQEAGVDPSRVIISPINDYFTSDNMWVSRVQGTVDSYCLQSMQSARTDPKICMVGCEKDESSYYIKYFKDQWPFFPNESDGLNATDIREAIFLGGPWASKVPKTVSDFLVKFKITSEYLRLQRELVAIKNYPDEWGDGPFVTVDPVVLCRGQILLVTRKNAPGEGLLALPGGFLGMKERIVDATIRELQEETKIGVPTAVLYGSIKDTRVFDHPLRDRRSRIITHASLIVLNEKTLPKVKGSDDAAKAKWYDLEWVLKDPRKLYGDHHQIINFMKDLERK